MASLNGLKKILLLTLALSAGSASAFSERSLSQPIEAMEELSDRALTLKNATADALLAQGHTQDKKAAPVFVIDAPADHTPLTPLDSLKNAYALLKGALS